MATLETQMVDEVLASSRRKMLSLGGAALAGLFLSSTAGAQAAAPSDTDVLNFALNLEYLEANFYTLASAGQTIDQAGLGITGLGAQGTVITKSGGPSACKVPFTNSLVQSYATEITTEEQNHVKFLRSALGGLAVAQPQIDLYNSFNALWNAVVAFLYTDQKLPIPSGTPTTFDPFATDANFLLGSYIFEDVGVTAYSGAAPLLITTPYLSPAAGIQGVEAYHAGLIRTTIAALDQSATTLGPAGTLKTIATAISGVRASLDGTGTSTAPLGDDLGLQGQKVLLNGASLANTALVGGQALYDATTITDASTTSVTVSTDANGNTVLSGVGGSNGSLVAARTPAQVLAIVYAGGASGGAFFPVGVNGFFAPAATTTAG